MNNVPLFQLLLSECGTSRCADAGASEKPHLSRVQQESASEAGQPAPLQPIVPVANCHLRRGWSQCLRCTATVQTSDCRCVICNLHPFKFEAFQC